MCRFILYDRNASADYMNGPIVLRSYEIPMTSYKQLFGNIVNMPDYQAAML